MGWEKNVKRENVSINVVELHAKQIRSVFKEIAKMLIVRTYRALKVHIVKIHNVLPILLFVRIKLTTKLAYVPKKEFQCNNVPYHLTLHQVLPHLIAELQLQDKESVLDIHSAWSAQIQMLFTSLIKLAMMLLLFVKSKRLASDIIAQVQGASKMQNAPMIGKYVLMENAWICVLQ